MSAPAAAAAPPAAPVVVCPAPRRAELPDIVVPVSLSAVPAYTAPPSPGPDGYPWRPARVAQTQASPLCARLSRKVEPATTADRAVASEPPSAAPDVGPTLHTEHAPALDPPTAWSPWAWTPTAASEPPAATAPPDAAPPGPDGKGSITPRLMR